MFSILIFPILLLNQDNLQNLNLEVWLNKDDNTFQVGEKLEIFFQTNHDCYVAIYNINARGEEQILFPPEGGDGFVRKDSLYQLPHPDADYEYEVTGPEGCEKIIVIASSKKLPVLSDTEDVVRKELEFFIQEPEPAKLRIISNPPKCKIYVKSIPSGEWIYIGRAPRTLILKPGEYLVEIRKWGYQTVKRRIKLEPEEKRRVYVTLLPW
jgi:hypothetical protein